MRYRAILAIALAALVALPDVSHAARILTVRDLTANPKRYNHQYVTVRAFGYFSTGGHTYRLLQDEKQMRSMGDMRAEELEKNLGCLTVINRGENRNRFPIWHRRTVTVSGHFHADTSWGDNYFGCGIGHVWGLEIEKVLSVEGPRFPLRETSGMPPFPLGSDDEILTGNEPQFAELKHWQQVVLKDEQGKATLTRFARHPDWGYVLRSAFDTPYGDGALSLWRDKENVVHYSTNAGLPEELK